MPTGFWSPPGPIPQAPKHRGISLFLVDLSSPGVRVVPLETMNDARQDETHFDDVLVPRDNVVGALHTGWFALIEGMDLERASTLGNIAELRRDFEDFVAWLRRHPPCRLERSVLRQTLADVVTGIESAHALCWAIMRELATGQRVSVRAAEAHLLFARVAQCFWDAVVDALGEVVIAPTDTAVAPFPSGRYIQHRWLGSRVLSIWGGSAEIQRIIIATRGLGLPK